MDLASALSVLVFLRLSFIKFETSNGLSRTQWKFLLERKAKRLIW